MSSFVLPQHHPAIRRGPLYERVVSACIRRASVVTVPSSSVKADIVRVLPDIREEKIRVIPCGIDDAFRPRPAAEVKPVLERLGLPSRYILFVGTLDPRKNLPTLIDAFAEVVRSGCTESLVLAGDAGWSPNELLQRIERTEIRNRIHLTGYIAEADLPLVYAGAALFVYPSLLEGFGFPPLEAMACGVPVVASDSSSLRENLSGAGVLVPSDDAKRMAAAMHDLLTNEAGRTRAIEAGLERSRAYRWDRFAGDTFACYEAVR